MKNIVILTGLTLSIALLTACGGGSSSDDASSSSSGGSSTGGSSTGGSSTGGSSTGGSSTGGSSSGGTAGVNPVTPLTSFESQTFEILSQQRTSTIESGFDGSIEVTTETTTFNGTSFVTQTFQLANGVPSINVTDLQKTEVVDISCDNGINGTGTTSYDYSSGSVVASGTSSEGSLACTSTFQSILPTTISDESSIDDLLDDWGDDDDLSNAAQSGLINTDCPQGDDDFDDLDPTIVACSGSFLTNYVVTDDNNEIHKLSTKITFSF